MPIEQDDFFQKFPGTEKNLERAGISWDELASIHGHYTARREEFEGVADYITKRLMSQDPVHSVRARVKDPEHLLEKILRKTAKDPTREICANNYDTEITDLVGVRALHLTKNQWLEIHRFITEEFELAEDPCANVREGDSSDFLALYKNNECTTKIHKAGYRSVHYIVKSRPQKREVFTEVQVRTIFEEGWSELDHAVRYPYFMNDPLINEFLLIFNRIAGAADEMGSFIGNLASGLDDLRSALLKKQQSTESNVLRIEKLLQQFEGHDKLKAQVLSHLESLKEPPPTLQELETIEQVASSDGDNRLLGVGLTAGGLYALLTATNPWLAGLGLLTAFRGYEMSKEE